MTFRSLLIHWAATFLAVLIASAWLPVFRMPLTLEQAAIFAAVLALLNTFIRPIVALATCPFYLLTIGLFTLIVNALMFWLAAALIQGVEIQGFFAAFLGALVVSVVSFLVSHLVRR